jgi:ABC-type lipoprotein export system ATPase subunit
MNKIRIKNFGPIKEGYLDNDGWLEVKKVTVFIGNQGSGKSTVAKLISTMAWIEKAMVKGILRQDELANYNRFIKQLAYQRIDKYITEATIIEYSGKAFSFSFSNGNFTAVKSIANGYALPKIMYVPSERNFLSVVDRPDKIKNLPKTLYTFNDEFDAAKDLFAEGLDLPINKVRFEYDKLNKIAHIVGENKSFRLRLSEASSGFQSTVPLYLVTKYLSDKLTAEEDPSVQETSLEEQKKINKEVKAIMEDPLLTPDIRQAYLRQLSARRKPVCFINIVEEPEQNLFPSSQRNLLFDLLQYNQAEGNQLIMTTHSPYIISYLTIAIQAAYLRNLMVEKGKNNLLANLFSIVKEQAQIDSNEVLIYELNEVTGTISKLPNPYGIPSDKNYLNQSIKKGNEIFDSLLELEEGL